MKLIFIICEGQSCYLFARDDGAFRCLFWDFPADFDFVNFFCIFSATGAHLVFGSS